MGVGKIEEMVEGRSTEIESIILEARRRNAEGSGSVILESSPRSFKLRRYIIFLAKRKVASCYKAIVRCISTKNLARLMLTCFRFGLGEMDD